MNPTMTAAALSATGMPSINLFPPNSNPILHITSSAGLYNTSLILITSALLLHTFVFGLIFLSRGFSASRALDTQFLTIVFALSFPISAYILLLSQEISAFKLFFFLDHEIIEILLAFRVLLPKKLLVEQGGAILMGSWFGLCVLSVIVASNPGGHAADVVAWCSFVSDGMIATAGAALIRKFFTERKLLKAYRDEVAREEMIQFWGWKREKSEESEKKESTKLKKTWERKILAEGLAGIGFIIHGVSTMTVGPIWTRVLYYGLDPKYFAYAWVVVYGCSLITVALCVPSAALFFSTIRWCCWHDRKLLPGQPTYYAPESTSEIGSDVGKSNGSSPTKGSIGQDDKPSVPERQRSRFSNWFSFSGPSRRASPKADPMEQWDKIQQQYIETQARALAHVQGSFSNAHSRQGSFNAMAKVQQSGTPILNHTRSDSATNSSMTANEINLGRHGRTGTQESTATMFLPPSPLPPTRINGAQVHPIQPQIQHLQPAAQSPPFVFPQVPHHQRRVSSLTRLAAIKREQAAAANAQLQQQQLGRRAFGSEGSLRTLDGKGKSRKRSISASAGESGSHNANYGMMNQTEMLNHAGMFNQAGILNHAEVFNHGGMLNHPAMVNHQGMTNQRLEIVNHPGMVNQAVMPGSNLFYWNNLASSHAGEGVEIDGGRF